MKLIAVNIFDFTSWYKFGYRNVFKDQIIDSLSPQIGEEIIYKTGSYEEEYELFFLEIDSESFSDNQNSIYLSLEKVKSIKPLTRNGGNILANKIPDFNISEPIDASISKIISTARNKHLAITGGERLCKTFHLDTTLIHKNYGVPFLLTLEKYFNDLNAQQDSMLDSILFYERAKPYPLSDVGYLFDVGAIARNRFNLSDEDFKQVNAFKDSDFHKYELVNEILMFSKYLQENKNNEKGVWTSFIQEFEKSEWLVKLNNDLSIIDNQNDLEINNILVISFFIKFRYLIRNTNNLDSYQFNETIRQHLEKRPAESSISLYLVGMFFGALKFKEIYYNSNPLSIMKKVAYKSPKEKLVKEVDIISDEEKSDFKNSINISTEVKSNQEKGVQFDETLWLEFERKSFHLTKEQIKIVRGCFDFAMKGNENELFSSRHVYFINLLKKKLKSAKEKTSPEKKLNQSIIEQIQVFLSEIFQNT